MQTSLELAAVVEEELFEQNQKAIAKRQYYHDLFQLCPEAYLVVVACKHKRADLQTRDFLAQINCK